jgi:hypothetical protein
MDLAQCHNCEKCQGKIVLISIDEMGVTRCGYCDRVVDYKRYYDNNINLVELLNSNKEKVSKKYIIPFLLDITKEVKLKEWNYKFVKSGSSGGVDIDMDFDPDGKEKIQEYLFNKFGKERVLHVGTFSRLGPASAAKDLLRIYKVDFKESNEFTSKLNATLSWEDNLAMLKEKFPRQYEFYQANKSVLDLVPPFINKIRQGGQHAGGIVILDEPVWKRIPVDRVSGDIVTAFPESAQEQVLDELGVVKFDILAITILDVIRNTIKMLDGKKLLLIEEDGIRKLVSEDYVDKKVKEL